MFVETFVVPGLGHSSYLIGREGSHDALVIDPRRDVQHYLDAADRQGVHITHVLETHNHNDFVSGSRELAAQTGAIICAAAESGIEYEFRGLRESATFSVAGLDFEVLATPGHTPEHISFLARDGGQAALFSGGSLLVGAVGRTDLLGWELADPLARLLYHTIQHKIARLADDVKLYPTHGAGSFCGSGNLTSNRSSTIGYERLSNPAMAAQSEDEFVARQLGRLGPFPNYYQYMRAINQSGPHIIGQWPSPHPLSVERASELIDAGSVVVDGREPGDFSALHIKGAFNVALSDDAFAPWVGWITPFNAPMLLVLPQGEYDWPGANTALLRIGYEQVSGYLAGGVAAWQQAGLPVQHISQIKAQELPARLDHDRDLILIDVRDDREWQAGHLPQATHIEAGTLSQRLGELPAERPIITICAAGFRSSIAASILQHAGFPQVFSTLGGMDDIEHAHAHSE
jgi:hydroxyacylglutathione hydrolase